jgi:hypothetical protein
MYEGSALITQKIGRLRYFRLLEALEENSKDEKILPIEVDPPKTWPSNYI